MTPVTPVQDRYLKVLHVDDAPLIRRMLAQQLQGIPALKIVGVAETAREGISEFELHGPDVVVLDLALREGNGFEVLRAIKQRSPACRVLVFTSHDTGLFRSRCATDGAEAFLSKSSQFPKLIQLLRGLADGPPADPGQLGQTIPGPTDPLRS